MEVLKKWDEDGKKYCIACKSGYYGIDVFLLIGYTGDVMKTPIEGYAHFYDSFKFFNNSGIVKRSVPYASLQYILGFSSVEKKLRDHVKKLSEIPSKVAAKKKKHIELWGKKHKMTEEVVKSFLDSEE